MKKIIVILLTLILNGNFVYGQIVKTKEMVDNYQDSIRKIEIEKQKIEIEKQKIVIYFINNVEILEDSVITLINNYRDSIGLNRLIYLKQCNHILREQARIYLDKINPSFNTENIKNKKHITYAHINCQDRLFQCSEKMKHTFNIICENALGGDNTNTINPYDFFYGWLNSKGHKENIEYKEISYITIGFYVNTDGHYFTYNCFFR